MINFHYLDMISKPNMILDSLKHYLN